MDNLVYKFPTDPQFILSGKNLLLDKNSYFPDWDGANHTIYGGIMSQLGVYVDKVNDTIVLFTLPDSALLLVPEEFRNDFAKRAKCFDTWFVIETEMDSLLRFYLDKPYTSELMEEIKVRIDGRLQALGHQLQEKFLYTMGAIDGLIQDASTNTPNHQEV